MPILPANPRHRMCGGGFAEVPFACRGDQGEALGRLSIRSAVDARRTPVHADIADTDQRSTKDSPPISLVTLASVAQRIEVEGTTMWRGADIRDVC